MGIEPSGRAQEAMTGGRDLARRFVSRYYPDVEAALLAGSRVRGEATSGSDYDVVLLFRALPEGAWRAMSLFEGRHIELFAHDLATLACFCREVDRPSGMAALPSMIAEGVALVIGSPATLEAARKLAHETLGLGPPELDQAAIRARRYALTDLAMTLDGSRETHIRMAAGAALYTALADFALRAANRWSAFGKTLPRLLRAMDADLALRFEAAFSSLFATGDVAPVQALVDVVLAPLQRATARGVPSRGAGQVANYLRPCAVMRARDVCSSIRARLLWIRTGATLWAPAPSRVAPSKFCNRPSRRERPVASRRFILDNRDISAHGDES